MLFDGCVISFSSPYGHILEISRQFLCGIFWLRLWYPLVPNLYWWFQFLLRITILFLCQELSLNKLFICWCICSICAFLSILNSGWVFNPFTLRAAKTCLTILMIFFKQKHFLENNWRRNYNRKPNNNSPSNILWNFASFPSYFQKYKSSRRYFLQVWMG